MLSIDFKKDETCLFFTVAQIACYLALIFGLIQKLPQILKIIDTSSVEGLEPTSLYSELLMHINTLGVYLHLAVPFSVYASNLVMNSACIFILLLCWKFNKRISVVEKGLVSTSLFFYAFLIF